MRLAVYTGASLGSDPLFAEAVRSFATALARRGVGIVYGGGHVGLMGVVADAALAAGGEVVGVMPQSLVDDETAHPGLTELRIVGTMHERKAEMAALADGFVALPGGLGTLEEIFEAWTWLQLGVHAKPVGFLDVAGYWRPLLDAVASMSAAGLVRPEYRDAAVVAQDADELLARFAVWEAPRRRWPEPPAPDGVPAPTGSAPTGSAPTESAPTRSAPTRSAATGSEPTRSAPIRSAATESAPTRSEPTGSAPTRSAPTRSAPRM
ncbi:TIGR00730 family Rossman fold protein [uncultured Kocuria sp.]|uniref:LOG family protein n=1 Tax=uncultured Kocuria sp. TaxID=259305 RepID=UPI0026366AF7|nr:TIGR00730 family Rossman fold protein [uncultured Kocuria sp.]